MIAVAAEEHDPRPLYVLVLEDQLDRVRRYCETNRDVWTQEDSDPNSRADQLAAAYADIYQKVLNVLETGQPL